VAQNNFRVVAMMLIIGVVSAGLGLWAAQTMMPTTGHSDDISALVFPQPRSVAPFTLMDHHRRDFSNQNLVGKWTMVFVGYANCPDICPTTLSTLNTVYKKLQEHDAADKLQVVFLSVDPDRDSVASLAEFVPFFNPDFIGLTGAIEDINRLSHSLSAVYFMPQDESRDNNYAVDHSSAIMLINPQGHWLARFSAPHNAELIATDFRKISDL